MDKKKSILIIDNKSTHIKELKNLIKKYYSYVAILPYNQINFKRTEKYDLIILSGGTNMALFKNLQVLKKEVAMIKRTNKPLIGICLGFQIISFAFGSKLKRRDKAVKGIINITLNESHFGKKSCKVYVAHKWYISSLSKKLLSLGKSKEDIEIIKHRRKQIYGLQFHPEIIKPSNGGAKIFINLIRNLFQK